MTKPTTKTTTIEALQVVRRTRELLEAYAGRMIPRGRVVELLEAAEVLAGPFLRAQPAEHRRVFIEGDPMREIQPKPPAKVE